MRDNDEDRFCYEWQRHEEEQLARLHNPSREDAARTRQEPRQGFDWGNVILGAVLGTAIALVVVSELS